VDDEIIAQHDANHGLNSTKRLRRTSISQSEEAKYPFKLIVTGGHAIKKQYKLPQIHYIFNTFPSEF